MGWTDEGWDRVVEPSHAERPRRADAQSSVPGPRGAGGSNRAVGRILDLQRKVGNQATSQLLEDDGPTGRSAFQQELGAAAGARWSRALHSGEGSSGGSADVDGGVAPTAGRSAFQKELGAAAGARWNRAEARGAQEAGATDPGLAAAKADYVSERAPDAAALAPLAKRARRAAAAGDRAAARLGPCTDDVDKIAEAMGHMATANEARSRLRDALDGLRTQLPDNKVGAAREQAAAGLAHGEKALERLELARLTHGPGIEKSRAKAAAKYEERITTKRGAIDDAYTDLTATVNGAGDSTSERIRAKASADPLLAQLEKQLGHMRVCRKRLVTLGVATQQSDQAIAAAEQQQVRAKAALSALADQTKTSLGAAIPTTLAAVPAAEAPGTGFDRASTGMEALGNAAGQAPDIGDAQGGAYDRGVTDFAKSEAALQKEFNGGAEVRDGRIVGEKDSLRQQRNADNREEQNLAMAGGVSDALGGVIGIAAAWTKFAQSDKEAWDVADAFLGTAKGAAGTAKGVTATIAADAKKGASMKTSDVKQTGDSAAQSKMDVAADAALGSDFIAAIVGAYTVVKSAWRLFRGTNLTAKEKEDLKRDGLTGALEMTKATMGTVKGFLSKAGEGTGQLADAIPGFGIAMKVVQILMSAYDAIRAWVTKNASRKDKRTIKEQILGGRNVKRKTNWYGGSASAKDEAESFIRANQAAYDAMTLDTTNPEHPKGKQLPPGALFKADEYYELCEEYLLSKGLQYVSTRKFSKASVSIGVNLTNIAGDVAVLSGAGAMVGVGIKAAATGVDLASKAYFAYSQGSTNKIVERNANLTLAMLVRIHECVEASPPQFARAEDIRVRFERKLKGYGLKMKDLQRFEQDPARMRKLLVDTQK